MYKHTPVPMSSSPTLRRDLAAVVALLAAVMAVFWQVRGFDFVNFDDPEYVTGNPDVAGGLDAHGVTWAFTRFHAGHWHPLTWLSHMVDVTLWGMNPGAHHLMNLLLFVVASVLLFGWWRRLGADSWPAALLTALFCLHPLRAESVAWVTGRKDMLSLLFLLGVFHAYLSWVQTPSAGRRWLTGVCLALGLMCKPTLVVTPVLLLCLDVWPLRRLAPHSGVRKVWPLLWEKAPLLALAAVSAAVTVLAQKAGNALVGTEQVDLGLRLANAAVAPVAYVGQMLWPVQLAAFYPLRAPQPGVAAACAALMAGALTAAWQSRANAPWRLAGLLFYLAALLPVVGLVQVGGQAMADRYVLIPSLGLWVLLCGEVCRGAMSAPPPRALLGVGTAWAVALAGGCAWQVSHWRNSETLWTRALEVVPDNFMAHTNLAVALEAAGWTQDAALHQQEAARLNPSWPTAQNNLGNAKARAGDYAAAEAHYRRALQRQPGLVQARYNLGLAMAFQGRLSEAEQVFRDTLSFQPDYAHAHDSLGDLLWKRGAYSEASAHLATVVAQHPQWLEAQARYGLVLMALGQTQQAQAHLRVAAPLATQDTPLGAALRTYTGDIREP